MIRYINPDKNKIKTVYCCFHSCHAISKYLHYLRHYRDKRLEAGYHKLDKSKVKEKDMSVKNMEDLENIVSKYKGFIWNN